MTAVAACGFGRCGSTMLMTMLDAGGVPPVVGSAPVSYELPSLDSFTGLSADDLEGRAVKLLDEILRGPLPPARAWRIVWLDRDPRHQSRSQVKLLRDLIGLQLPRGAAGQLAGTYRRDRGLALDALAEVGPVHVATYEEALRDPARFAAELAAFLAPELRLDQAAAAAVVHRRRPYCAPDLQFELTGQPA
jgi:hypothetical protein